MRLRLLRLHRKPLLAYSEQSTIFGWVVRVVFWCKPKSRLSSERVGSYLSFGDWGKESLFCVCARLCSKDYSCPRLWLIFGISRNFICITKCPGSRFTSNQLFLAINAELLFVILSVPVFGLHLINFLALNASKIILKTLIEKKIAKNYSIKIIEITMSFILYESCRNANSMLWEQIKLFELLGSYTSSRLLVLSAQFFHQAILCWEDAKNVRVHLTSRFLDNFWGCWWGFNALLILSKQGLLILVSLLRLAFLSISCFSTSRSVLLTSQVIFCFSNAYSASSIVFFALLFALIQLLGCSTSHNAPDLTVTV